MAIAHIQDMARTRARNYWELDGIPLLLGGALYLGVLGSCWIILWVLMDRSFFDRHWILKLVMGTPATILFIFSPLLAIGGMIWLRFNWEDLVEWFKIRLTYPRTGYVAPPSRSAGLVDSSQSTNPLYQITSLFNGFWLWLFVMYFRSFWDSAHSRQIAILLLGVLLVVRALKFLVTPEVVVAAGRKHRIVLQIANWIGSVLSSWWVWILLNSLLRTPSPAVCVLLILGGLLAVRASAFPVLLARLERFEAASVCLCGAGFAFLAWRNNVAIAFLLPGLCAAFIGSFRLYRYLRANPVQPI